MMNPLNENYSWDKVNGYIKMILEDKKRFTTFWKKTSICTTKTRSLHNLMFFYSPKDQPMVTNTWLTTLEDKSRTNFIVKRTRKTSFSWTI